MDKVLDTLTLYFRTLILASAIILVIAISHLQRGPQTAQFQAESLTAVEKSFRQLRGDIRLDATKGYRADFQKALGNRYPTLRSALNAIQFMPPAFYPGSPFKKTPIAVLGDKVEMTLLTATQFVEGPETTFSFPYMTFNGADVRNVLLSIERDSRDRPLLHSGDLVIVVNPPQEGSAGTCLLIFTSATLDLDRHLRTFDLHCRPRKEPAIVTSQVRAFLADVPPALYFAPELMFRNISDAKTRAADMLKEETDQKAKPSAPVKFLGAEVEESTALQVGPFVIVALLLMMIGPLRIVATHEPKIGIEGAAWFSQFCRFWPSFVTVAIFVIVPSIAAFFAGGLASDGRHAVIKASIAGLVVAALSVVLFYLSAKPAKRWDTRINPPPPAQNVPNSHS